MTISEAKHIVWDFEELSDPTEDDIFMFTEALGFLINETHDPRYMMHLGGYYYGLKKFDLAEKYYLMADECDLEEAAACLGYIYYYGRTGAPDHEKAFMCFSKSAELGNLQSFYKVADMYKNGYYVEKDYDKYVEMIEKLWSMIGGDSSAHYLVPEAATRLASIRGKQGRTEEALKLYRKARKALEGRLKRDRFFGNFTIMKMLIEDYYRYTEPDVSNIGLYDMYYLLKTPSRWEFEYLGKTHVIESSEEGGELNVCLDGKWYRDISEFIMKGSIKDAPLVQIVTNLKDFRKVS